MKKKNLSKKYDFKLELKKISPVRQLIGYLILIFGVCLSMTLILIIPGSFIGAIGYLLTIKQPKCPNCRKTVRVKYNDVVVHCKKCKENIYIIWK